MKPSPRHQGQHEQHPRVCVAGPGEALLARHGWELDASSTHPAALAGALASLTALGHLPSDELLDVYAEAPNLISEHDVGSVTESDRAAAAEHAVVSTLILEPVLLTLRRVALENASRRHTR